MQASQPKVEVMKQDQMREVVAKAKLGDKLRLKFADNNFDGSLDTHINMILAIDSIKFDELSRMSLQSVANHGEWREDPRNYSIEVMAGSDARLFTEKVIQLGIFDSIKPASERLLY
ncbi:MAG: hypothetical protein WCI79_02690 [Candidatus Saccharibacteria bacterium]